MNQSELEANTCHRDQVWENMYTVSASHDWFWFYFSLVGKVVRDFLANHSVTMQNQSNRKIIFDTQLKTIL